jgi:hypothetical protein
MLKLFFFGALLVFVSKAFTLDHARINVDQAFSILTVQENFHMFPRFEWEPADLSESEILYLSDLMRDHGLVFVSDNVLKDLFKSWEDATAHMTNDEFLPFKLMNFQGFLMQLRDAIKSAAGDDTVTTTIYEDPWLVLNTTIDPQKIALEVFLIAFVFLMMTL